MIKGAILYFSLTGNTKLACEYIKATVKDADFELIDMKTAPNDLSGYDMVGFATYSEGFSICKYVKDYIAGLKHAEDTPAFVFSTFGRNNGATTAVLARWATRAGFKVVADYALHTPENHPPTIRHDQSYENSPSKQEMDGFTGFIGSLSAICRRIGLGKAIAPKEVAVKRVYKMIPELNRPAFNRRMIGKKLVDTKRCTQCGRCAKACNYHAITMKEYPAFEEQNCHGCWACYNLCPAKAIYTKSFNQFGNYPRPSKHMREILKV